MKLILIAIATLLLNSLSTLQSQNYTQNYYRHCTLRVRYEGACLRIQNRNATECPSLRKLPAAEGHVLGYCDVVTSIDREPSRIPEVLIFRKCKPECTKSCAEAGVYFCEQIYSLMTVKENGTEWIKQVPSDCLCVKNTTRVDKIEEEYGAKGP